VLSIYCLRGLTRLGLVGVDDEEGGAAVGRLGHEGPLEAGGEAGAAAAAEAGVLNLLHNSIRTHPHHLLSLMPVSTTEGVGEAPVLLAVEVREDAILVGEAGVVGARRRGGVRERGEGNMGGGGIQ